MLNIVVQLLTILLLLFNFLLYFSSSSLNSSAHRVIRSISSGRGSSSRGYIRGIRASSLSSSSSYRRLIDVIRLDGGGLRLIVAGVRSSGLLLRSYISSRLLL